MERFKISPCGRYIGLIGSARKGGGMINILDSTTAQWIAQARVDGLGGVADFAWWGDGNGMVIASKNGEISEFDMRLRRVICRWTDAGAVGTTVVALGGSSGRPHLGGDRWVAVGSFSGIVNIYDRKPWQGAAAQAEQSKKQNIEDAIPTNPTPVRALEQLTTSITQIVFAPDGQFMVMASKWKRDALRLGKFSSFSSVSYKTNMKKSIYHHAPSTVTGPHPTRHLAVSHLWLSRRNRICWLLLTSRERFVCGRSMVKKDA